MALVCKSGVKECCGCGDCRENSSFEHLQCHFCGKALDGDDGYKDSIFAVLCLECLLGLHKL